VFLTPIACALLVWLTFGGATDGRALAGAMAAVLISVARLLYQVVQPMNDVQRPRCGCDIALIARRWALAGVCCGLALLVRPNLLPLALVSGLFVVADRSVTRVGRPIPSPKSPIPEVAVFLAAVFPFGLLVLWLNSSLLGVPEQGTASLKLVRLSQ
jgi:hypothetical protein